MGTSVTKSSFGFSARYSSQVAFVGTSNGLCTQPGEPHSPNHLASFAVTLHLDRSRVLQADFSKHASGFA